MAACYADVAIRFTLGASGAVPKVGLLTGGFAAVTDMFGGGINPVSNMEGFSTYFGVNRSDYTGPSVLSSMSYLWTAVTAEFSVNKNLIMATRKALKSALGKGAMNTILGKGQTATGGKFIPLIGVLFSADAAIKESSDCEKRCKDY